MKISENPVGTVIELGETGYTYVKHENGDWHAVNAEHFPEAMDGFVIPKDLIDNEQNDIKIIAMPYSVIIQMALMLQDEYGTVNSEGEDITLDGIIEDAVDEVHRRQQFEAAVEKHG